MADQDFDVKRVHILRSPRKSSEMDVLKEAVARTESSCLRVEKTVEKLVDEFVVAKTDIAGIRGQLMGIPALQANDAAPVSMQALNAKPTVADHIGTFVAQWTPTHVLILACLLIGGIAVVQPFSERATDALFGPRVSTTQLEGAMLHLGSDADHEEDGDTGEP